MPIQAVLCLLPGRAPTPPSARFYWRTVAWLMGLQMQVVGDAGRGAGRCCSCPTIPPGSTSWCSAAALDACFVAKREVGEWPVISSVARLGRTVFVSRSRTQHQGRGRRDPRAAAARATASSCSPRARPATAARVLPFRSAFLSVADACAGGAAGLGGVRPARRAAGLPARPAAVRLVRRHGHRQPFLARSRGGPRRGRRWCCTRRSTPRTYPDRKALTAACAEVVTEGCATLRQNRPPMPLSPPWPAPLPRLVPA